MRPALTECLVEQEVHFQHAVIVCTGSTVNYFKHDSSTGGSTPGRPSARHSLVARSSSSVLQNGCLSASLKRLSRAVGPKHSCCKRVAAFCW